MPAWVLPAIMAGSSLVSGLLGGRKKARTAEQTSTQTPTFLPESDPLRSNLLSQLLAGLNTEAELPAIDFGPLRQKGISDVNRAYGGLQEAIGGRLAERGLSFSPGPVSTAFATGESARFKSMADVLNELNIREAEQKAQLPLIREELRRQRLSDATRILPLFSGRTQTGTSVAPGDALASSFGAGASALFSGLGAGLFRRQPQVNV